MSSSSPLTARDFREIKRVLVRAANWIGDAVMTLPALQSIRQAFPKKHIAILTKPWVADLFFQSPLVDQVILYESPGRHEGIRGKWQLARELKKEGFDIAILFQNAFEAALISYLAGIPRRGGYNTDARGVLLTHAVRVDGEVRKGHQVDYYREMVKGLGLESLPAIPFLEASPGHKEEAGRILDSFGLAEEERIMGLGPGATFGPAKQWFPERFAALADRFSRDGDVRILVFGSRADMPTASLLVRKAQSPMIDLTGQTSLRQVIGLIARCRLFVSNDSGLMHVAAALGVPVLAIFGSTDAVRTGPLGKKCRVVKSPLPCSPCLKPRCPQNRECMEGISVDEVYEEAKILWNQERAAERRGKERSSGDGIL
jgi:heptosyltransferase II